MPSSAARRERIELSSRVLEALLHPMLRRMAARTGTAPVSLLRQRSCDTYRITSHGLLAASRTQAGRLGNGRSESAETRRFDVRPESGKRFSCEKVSIPMLCQLSYSTPESWRLDSNQ